jgi:transcriptional regulator GlxA family with amidase domain
MIHSQAIAPRKVGRPRRQWLYNIAEEWNMSVRQIERRFSPEFRAQLERCYDDAARRLLVRGIQ